MATPAASQPAPTPRREVTYDKANSRSYVFESPDLDLQWEETGGQGDYEHVVKEADRPLMTSILSQLFGWARNRRPHDIEVDGPGQDESTTNYAIKRNEPNHCYDVQIIYPRRVIINPTAICEVLAFAATVFCTDSESCRMDSYPPDPSRIRLRFSICEHPYHFYFKSTLVRYESYKVLHMAQPASLGQAGEGEAIKRSNWKSSSAPPRKKRKLEDEDADAVVKRGGAGAWGTALSSVTSMFSG
jgi:hypothetical protein